MVFPYAGRPREITAMRSGVLVCMVLLLVTGCARNPSAMYGHLQSTEKSRIVPGFEEAIRSARAVQLQVSSKNTLELKETDPVISLGSYSSYFKLFRMAARAGTSYKFTIKGICHCLSFKKTVVVPHVYVLDERGELVVDGPQVTSPHEAGLTSTLHVEGTVESTIVKGGVYFLLVAGDNSRVGAPVTTVHESYQETSVSDKGKVTVGETKDLEQDIVSSPVGKVELRVEEARPR
jgi:hypothetical protein